MSDDRKGSPRPVFCDVVSRMMESRVTIIVPHIHLAIGSKFLS